LTRELGLPAERLYPTVYQDDDQAFALWQKIAGIPASRLTRLGKKDNFWSMGDTGPCGPCSEIIYDRGPQACTCGRSDCNLAGHCDRWLELWNLVFMQFDAREDGSLTPLAHPSIDTGMGLERITSVLQGVGNNYDTDLFLPIIARTRELLGHDEARMRANPVPYRVIADHSRAMTFLIADGVLPGNEGRNYVLRLILRRAARFGKLLGFEQPFLAQTARAVIETMGHHYTELTERSAFVCDAITQEEERFLSTLSTGLGRLEQLAARLREQGQDTIPGEEAFRLYDTFGFPLELTRDAATEMGLRVDDVGFRAAMAGQRERARAAQAFAAGAEGELYRQIGAKSEFVGYASTTTEARVLALVRDGQPVDAAEAGQDIEVVLDRTPFFAQSGGQVGDMGELRSISASVQVTDARKPLPDVVVLRGRVATGRLRVGDCLTASVDVERRLDIARNHTATHLLHRALRTVLGEHAAQSGSLVAPERLRFDFSHLAPMTEDELRRVEALVNEQVRADRPVSTRETDFDAAVKGGAIALFGEKYGDRVRVVQVEGYSSELCGGTHLQTTGQIGLFVIVAESSVGAGLRRIEALTGRGAEAYVREKLGLLGALGKALGARPGEELGELERQLAEARDQRRALQDIERQLAAVRVDALLAQAHDVAGVRVLAAEVQVADVNTLREMCDRFRDKLGSAVVALGALVDGRPMLVVAVTNDLFARGLHAGKLAGAAAARMGGGGGGKPSLAQAGGKDAAQLTQAVAAIETLVAQSLG
jgi:alanyl-tRNA synthetase